MKVKEYSRSGRGPHIGCGKVFVSMVSLNARSTDTKGISENFTFCPEVDGILAKTAGGTCCSLSSRFGKSVARTTVTDRLSARSSYHKRTHNSPEIVRSSRFGAST